MTVVFKDDDADDPPFPASETQNNRNPQTRNPQPATRNPKLETRNPQPANP
jgi:hypothetical protein